jgi:hypothetical protein
VRAKDKARRALQAGKDFEPWAKNKKAMLCATLSVEIFLPAPV